jgi:hypothetical protein
METMAFAVLVNGEIIQRDDEIAPFPLDVVAATRLYEAIIATGVKLSTDSWTPDHEERPDPRGITRTPEWISVHPYHIPPGAGQKLQSMGLTGNDRAGYAVLVQKHDWSLRDRYNHMTEEEQVRADLCFIDAGAWVDEERLQRLERYGYKVR